MMLCRSQLPCRIGPAGFPSKTNLSLRSNLRNRSKLQPTTRISAQGSEDKEQRRKDETIVYTVGVGLTAAVLLAARFGGGAAEDLDAWGGIGGFTAGSFAGSALWTVALYYASPVDLLLLFLGKIETERPSDWLLYKFGTAAKLDVDAIDYEAPLAIRAAMLLCTAIGGIAVSAAFQALLEDATWSVSTGMGACIAGFVYETGRPDRLSVDEAQVLEGQWQDFAAFAEDALVRKGRAHETEVFSSFRKRFGRYRTEEQLSDQRLRDMIRNWNPQAERSRTGWYKNVSLKQYGAPETQRRSVVAPVEKGVDIFDSGGGVGAPGEGELAT